MSLTPKQRRILDFIQEYRREHKGVSPTLHEIRRHLGLGAVSTVHAHVVRLTRQGLVKRAPNDKRGLIVTELPRGEARILPLTGRVSAGLPVEALEEPETLQVPSFLLKSGQHYVLKVAGDSMIGEGIHDGDWIIVQKRESAGDGETVVALVNGEVTLKRYFREGRYIRLQPSNPAVAPLKVREADLTVQGVVVGLMRKYS